MGKNTLLGSIDYVAYTPVETYGPTADIAQSPNPTDVTTNVISLPPDSYKDFQPVVTYVEGGPSGGGGDISFKPFDYVPPTPEGGTSVSLGPGDESPKPMSKKNMMLIGIGALVLGYLIFRKK